MGTIPDGWTDRSTSGSDVVKVVVTARAVSSAIFDLNPSNSLLCLSLSLSLLTTRVLRVYYHARAQRVRERGRRGFCVEDGKREERVFFVRSRALSFRVCDDFFLFQFFFLVKSTREKRENGKRGYLLLCVTRKGARVVSFCLRIIILFCSKKLFVITKCARYRVVYIFNPTLRACFWLWAFDPRGASSTRWRRTRCRRSCSARTRRLGRRR